MHDLLLCGLPYHGTNEFVRLVQTLALKGTTWEWLTPMQRSGASMPRHVLITRLSSDKNTLRAICKAAEDMGNPRCISATFLSFYAVSVVELLMGLQQVSEDTLRLLLPYLVTGLKPNTSRDYHAASLMVLTQLCAKAQLADEFLSCKW